MLVTDWTVIVTVWRLESYLRISRDAAVSAYVLFRVYFQIHASPFTGSFWLDLPL
ncbi:hypothetical protein DPMN_054288 [Dreissena polymorpha]|uniref:Uncharacterized protein n=1 Tax=Dreissena polymorpha TaxID=45954 RepID=A0A9D4HR31_DREPO|nr:hypothetical protein DPMN_054288 [Dreissena polymorpha]